MGFITSDKGMMLYDIRNMNQTLWDARNYANKTTNDKNNDLSINKQFTKIRCFPRGGGFVVGGVDGRCWIKT